MHSYKYQKSARATLSHHTASSTVKMVAMLILALGLCALFAPVMSTTAFSSIQIQEFVDAHNKMRRWEFSASNMNILRWNTELADMAQEYANQCSGGHGQAYRANPPFANIGQNIYMTQASTIENVTAVVEAWYDEKPWYTYSSNQCSPPPNQSCGHYTQVVWGDTTDVGCGVKTCYNHIYPLYVYCNYGPAGNWVGEKPYSTGGDCTECSSGSGWCNGTLCDDSCTSSSECCSCERTCQNCGEVNPNTCECNCKPGYLGDSCETVCEDTDASCGGNPGWPASWCNTYSFVYDACPLMCGVCSPPNGNPCY